MICLEAQYFKPNKLLLQATGLWPFEQSKLVQFQFTILFSIVVSALIFQLTTFLTAESPFESILQISASALIFVILILSYSAIHFNIHLIKDLLLELHCTCKELKDENEIAIVKKFGYSARRFTLLLIVCGICSIVILFISQISPIILDRILPINKSRSLQLQIATEYFLDQNKYFYLMTLHMDTALFIAQLAIIAVGAMFLTYCQHTCGMFTIASYRITHAMQITVPQTNKKKIEHLISERIACAVHIHRQAITLTDSLVSSFEKTYFCITTIAVITLSLNLFQAFQIMESANVTEAIFPIIIAGVITVLMFFATYVGQTVTDHSNEMYAAAYNIQWYMFSVHIQKLVLFLLQRSTKGFYLTCGGLFVASLECFATLVKASVSYFTLISSAQ